MNRLVIDERMDFARNANPIVNPPFAFAVPLFSDLQIIERIDVLCSALRSAQAHLSVVCSKHSIAREAGYSQGERYEHVPFADATTWIQSVTVVTLETIAFPPPRIESYSTST